MSDPVRLVNCPTCHKPTPWTRTNKHRPFCSERCRLVDFGDWANERHRIPGERLEDVSSADLERDEGA